ncbi:MAG TPA: lipid-binding SYLF domain-containing protein [Kiloniellales bacterium]|jgi:lipid-binding SYLF domain-containing protein|nr:lipid-binding SYLF domain-containing protein [Kiloniellales bacterium]
MHAFVLRPRLPRLAALLMALTLLVGFQQPAVADDRADAADLVDRARVTLSSLLRDPQYEQLETYLRAASGVIIFPQLVRGGFIVGAEGGSGVLLARSTDNSWGPPAFVRLTAGSIGLQIGGQVSETILVIMNDGALDAVLSQNFSFGGDLSVAVGPVGHGVRAGSTANLGGDIIAFSRTQGLFGGGSLEGAALTARNTLNAAYYDAPSATPYEIAIERRYHNVAADPLIQSLP